MRIQKIADIEDGLDNEVEDNKEFAEWGDSYDLKKIAVEVHSKEESELNKDFTLSDLNDQLFESKTINYIMGRIGLLKLIEIVMPYANTRNITKDMSEKDRLRILAEKVEYRKLRKVILSEVRIILVMSRARGGKIIKSFLAPDTMTPEGQAILEEEEKPRDKRGFFDKLLGRKK